MFKKILIILGILLGLYLAYNYLVALKPTDKGAPPYSPSDFQGPIGPPSVKGPSGPPPQY